MAGSSALCPASACASVTAPAIAVPACAAMVTISGTPSLVSMSATPGAAWKASSTTTAATSAWRRM